MVTIESHYKTMEVIIVQSIIKSVLDSIEAISERSLATLSSLMSGDNSESHYKTMEVLIITVHSFIVSVGFNCHQTISERWQSLPSLMSGDN